MSKMSLDHNTPIFYPSTVYTSTYTSTSGTLSMARSKDVVASIELHGGTNIITTRIGSHEFEFVPFFTVLALMFVAVMSVSQWRSRP